MLRQEDIRSRQSCATGARLPSTLAMPAQRQAIRRNTNAYTSASSHSLAVGKNGDVEGEFPVVRDGGHADGSRKQIVDAGDSSTCSPEQGYPGDVLMKEGSGSEQKLRREITIAGHELNPGQIAVTNADNLPVRRVAGIGREHPFPDSGL